MVEHHYDHQDYPLRYSSSSDVAVRGLRHGKGGLFDVPVPQDRSKPQGSGSNAIPYLFRNDTVVLIWFVAALVVVLVCFIGLVIWFLRRQFGIAFCRRGRVCIRDPSLTASRQREASALADRRRKEAELRSLERKISVLREVTVVVEDAHLVRGRRDDLEATVEAGTLGEEGVDGGSDAVVLRIPGVRHGDGTCVICQTEYEVGDKVVCSPNLGCCRRPFHRACILEWMERGKHGCPCCRETFIPDTCKDVAAAQRDNSDEAHASTHASTHVASSHESFDAEMDDLNQGCEEHTGQEEECALSPGERGEIAAAAGGGA